MKLHFCQKRAATLIEVLIATCLTVIVLSTLTYFYQQITMISLEIDEVKQEDFYLRYIDSRLVNTLPMALSPKKSDFVFFSFEQDEMSLPGTESLVFSFVNGVMLNPLFANHVVARLFVDKEERLMLAYWPSRSKWIKGEKPPMKKEILQEGVKGLKFAFFAPPDGSIADQPIEKGSWRTQPWLQEFNRLPAMVKIEVDMGDGSDKRQFIYPLPQCSCHIILMN
jgi:hypothetical protein